LSNAENAIITLLFSFPSSWHRLVEETNNLSSNVLGTGLLVVHDTGRGGQDDIAELTGGQQLDNPLLEIGETDVVAGRDDTGLVEAAVELDNDLARAVVVDLLELADVAYEQKESAMLRQFKPWTSCVSIEGQRKV
jgi:hypothetical protein